MKEIEDRVKIAATGPAWVGRGTRSIWSMVRDSFNNAEREIVIAAYSLSETSPEFYNILDSCLVRGIRVLLIVNRLTQQPEFVQEGLIAIRRKYKNFLLKSFEPSDKREDLHAKLIVVDHKLALIGSANPTWKGMVMNHEVAVCITGRQAAALGHLVDRLSTYHDCKTVAQNRRTH